MALLLFISALLCFRCIFISLSASGYDDPYMSVFLVELPRYPTLSLDGLVCFSPSLFWTIHVEEKGQQCPPSPVKVA